MAKQQEEQILDISESFNKTERYIEDNKKSLGIIFIAIAVVVGLYVAYLNLIVAPKEKDAQGQMYVAEQYFAKDSIDLAINGDGSFPGFKGIIDNYSITKSANLAQYYLGMCYLKKGDYQNALEYLGSYDPDDEITGALAIGAMGDAYMELGKSEDAASNYMKAADKDDNQFTTPVFLMKAGVAFESLSKYREALEAYQKIKDNFPETNEGRNIDKYLARAKALLKK
jgi:tetratricopeptide (TPR) repeat protein